MEIVRRAISVVGLTLEPSAAESPHSKKEKGIPDLILFLDLRRRGRSRFDLDRECLSLYDLLRSAGRPLWERRPRTERWAE